MVVHLDHEVPVPLAGLCEIELRFPARFVAQLSSGSFFLLPGWRLGGVLADGEGSVRIQQILDEVREVFLAELSLPATNVLEDRLGIAQVTQRDGQSFAGCRNARYTQQTNRRRSVARVALSKCRGRTVGVYGLRVGQISVDEHRQKRCPVLNPRGLFPLRTTVDLLPRTGDRAQRFVLKRAPRGHTG